MVHEHDIGTQKLLEQARSEVPEIPVDEAYRLFKNDGKTTFVDIREPEQVALGYITGSVFIRGDELEMQTRHLLPDKEAPVLLYCVSGSHSLMTGLTLKEMGYSDQQINHYTSRAAEGETAVGDFEDIIERLEKAEAEGGKLYQ